ncbi:hypothetical protein ACO0RG_002065 [Hanseniaspora osmophila]
MSNVIYTKPTIENVIPFELYKSTNPSLQFPNASSRFASISDTSLNPLLPILFGGGRNFTLTRMRNESFDSGSANPGSDLPGSTSNLCSAPSCLVDLFVMDCGIVVWFDQLNMGIQIQYSDLVYHGIVTLPNDPHQRLLVNVDVTAGLEVIWEIFGPGIASTTTTTTNNTTTSRDNSNIDLLFTPMYYENDRFYNSDIENLFQFQWFGLNKGNSMIKNINDALDHCMETYYTTTDYQNQDLDDENDNGYDLDNEAEMQTMVDNTAEYDGISVGLQHYYYHNNTGMADDLGG